MSIKDQAQAIETNDYGYLRIKLSGKWYGADKKGGSPIQAGDLIEIDTYQNQKGYDTFKFASLKKIAGAVAGAAPIAKGPAASKDEYWTDKEARDLAKEPRINFYAAFERAVGFVALAFQVGALKSLAGAKETAKLDILTALVDEQTQRILNASYAQEAPEVGEDETETETAETSTGDDAQSEGDDSQWK